MYVAFFFLVSVFIFSLPVKVLLFVNIQTIIMLGRYAILPTYLPTYIHTSCNYYSVSVVHIII